ncbi:MAG: hypothetical protein AB1629_07235 [Candidatus Omnitrophota bacterium]
MHSTSPEEKLLRLIKDATGKKDRHKEEIVYEKPKETVHPPASFKPRRQTDYARRKLILEILNLGSIDLLLRVGLVLLVLIFIFDIFLSNMHIKRVLTSSEKVTEGVNLNPLPEKLSGDFSHFSSDINTRDIFTASLRSTLDSSIANFGSGIAQYVNKLKLLGIISGEKKQAIIEDQSEQRNYTVSEGDYLKELLVEEVGSGKVTFDYKGEKFELFL